MGIRAHALSAGYDDRVVLDDISLRFAARRTTVLLGPGGSGKSTLLRVLAGAAAGPDFWCRGEVSASGPVAWLPQRPPPRAVSVASLVSPGAPQKAGDVVRRVWAEEPKASEALLPALDGQPGESGLWRLAFLTALLDGDQPVLLLDEPDAGLTPGRLAAVARRLSCERGRRTVVLVTHHLLFARMVSDAAVLLIDGLVLEAGASVDFFERPAHPRTRDFVRMGG